MPLANGRPVFASDVICAADVCGVGAKAEPFPVLLPVLPLQPANNVAIATVLNA